jgi:hypothetical protein
LFPAFATGSPLFLGKNFEDLLPTREYSFTNDTYRGVVSLDGDFERRRPRAITTAPSTRAVS